MQPIFISYRRDDCEGQAGRLFDDLVRSFGVGFVFMDVASVQPGRDFRKVIDEKIASCGVLLTLIGLHWLDARDEAGNRRLDNPTDFVRLETAAALKRDISVIPVFVQGARMPRADQLPEDLRELVYRNAVELTHARWDSDVELLIKALKQAISVEPQPGKSANVTRRSRLGLALFAGASLIAGISYMAISFRQKVAPRLPPTAVAVAARDKNPAGERETPKSPSVRTASTEEISTKVSVISYVRDGTNDHGEFRRSGTVWAETFSDLPAPRYWTEVANPPSGKLRLASGGAFIEIDLATKAIDYSDGTSPLRRLDTITSVARE